jgi:SAM-dependent methyltransferase
MNQYKDFAKVYAEGDYTQHSTKMAEMFSRLLEQYEVDPDNLLDIACGEGTFLRGLDVQGVEKKGIDLSERFIDIAREKSESGIDFQVGDMRSFSESGYDVVTCWYDSLNYLTDIEELNSAFRNVRSSLNLGGLFIFDMNTSYFLSDVWPSQGTYVSKDNDQVFELHRANYDEESRIFKLRITGFRKENGVWNKFEEVHREKAYKLSEVKSALEKQGFEILDIFGDIEDRKELESEDPRVWIVAEAR